MKRTLPILPDPKPIQATPHSTLTVDPTDYHKADTIKAVPHYAALKIQPVEFIVANGLGFLEGNVIKYVCRAPFKNGLEDLKKARQYLDWMIAKVEGKPLEVARG